MAFINWMRKQEDIEMHMYVHPAAGILAAFLAMPILAFFHFDTERVQRRCNLDQYFRPIAMINTDIIVAIFMLYTVALMGAMIAAGIEEAGDALDGGADGGADGVADGGADGVADGGADAGAAGG